MMLQEIERTLADKERLLERQIGEAKHIASEAKLIKVEVSELQETIESLDEAAGILNSYADSRQADLQTKIEALITHGLRTIFGEDLSFHIKQKQQGKLAAADFVVRSTIEGKEFETSILEARGGGVAAVAGFVLRLVLILLRKDVRPILFLDETFAQLSEEYEPRLAEFIRELVDKTSVQIVLVTHSVAYNDVADTVFRFSLDDGVTHITPCD